jgi:hypothetical protein
MNVMKTITKTDIIQRLLNQKNITPEEAVVLLTDTQHIETKSIQPFSNPWLDMVNNYVNEMNKLNLKENKD